MAIHISRIAINHFRGIHDLEVESLNHINIIAGDNNSGKTSILEALLLLRNPGDFSDALRLARTRDTNFYFGGSSLYENFINLFPRDVINQELGINANIHGKKVVCRLNGSVKKIMLDPNEVRNKKYSPKRSRINHDIPLNDVEAEAFEGEFYTKIEDKENKGSIYLDSYSTSTGREIKGNAFLDMIYLSPMDHVRGSVFDQIIKNEDYKEICIRILQQFDPEIKDLLLLRDENRSRAIEYIKHATLGNMPLSTYGDGIKKVLLLANGIARGAGGVLLIDEVETAIHSKYYDDIFRFLVKAAIQFDVQVFITTHNLEAIDALLSTQDYDKQDKEDNIHVLTFKKEPSSHKTYSRVLSGRHVHENRKKFDFEVRL